MKEQHQKSTLAQKKDEPNPKKHGTAGSTDLDEESLKRVVEALFAACLCGRTQRQIGVSLRLSDPQQQTPAQGTVGPGRVLLPGHLYAA